MSKQQAILSAIFASLSAPFTEISVTGDPVKKNIANLANVFGPDDWNKLPKKFTAAFDAVIKAKSGAGMEFEGLFNPKADKLRTNRAKVLAAYELSCLPEVSAEDFEKVLMLNYAVKETLQVLDIVEDKQVPPALLFWEKTAVPENNIDELETFLVSIIEGEETPEVVAEAPVVDAAPEQGVSEIADETPAEVAAEQIIASAENNPALADAVLEEAAEIATEQNLPVPTNLQEASEIVVAGDNAGQFILGMISSQAKMRVAVFTSIQGTLEALKQGDAEMSALIERHLTPVEA